MFFFSTSVWIPCLQRSVLEIPRIRNQERKKAPLASRVVRFADLKQGAHIHQLKAWPVPH